MPSLKRHGRWIMLLLGGMLLISAFSGRSGIIALYESRQEVKRMHAKVETLNHIADSLRETFAHIKADTVFIEHIAREKLGMAGKNEKVYKIIRK